jgi:hypothetical protein
MYMIGFAEGLTFGDSEFFIKSERSTPFVPQHDSARKKFWIL